jgi:two-component system response regulator MprA
MEPMPVMDHGGEALGMSDATRILVVDDDAKIRTVVRRGLAYEGYRVVEAASGAEGLEKAREHLPDLVILDIMMPGMDGLEVTRRLRSAGDEIAILMLTARDEVKDRVQGLETGADDYLVKPFSFEELLARVHALLRRRQAPGGEVLRFADLELDVDAREARRSRRTIELTTTEYNLLLLFLRHPRKVLTREVIMEHVWSYNFEGESNVLEVYVRYLRGKLESSGEPRLIHTVRGAGYVLKQ